MIKKKKKQFFPITSDSETCIDPVNMAIPINIIPNTAVISKPLSVLLCQTETRKRNGKLEKKWKI